MGHTFLPRFDVRRRIGENKSMNDNDFSSNLCTINEIDPEKVAFVQKQALPEDTVERVSRLFSALSDPTRLRILHALTLTKELCVCDLAALAELSVSAVSHQLRLLRDRDLVRARRDGRMVYYSVADDHIAILMGTGVEHAEE
jgi:DNA-binding transcriptional ArsR family regulator